jgi:hypothetical protein
MNMSRSAAILWCPHCKTLIECPSKHPSAVGSEGSTGGGFRIPHHEELQYFQRMRYCLDCSNEFWTAEVEWKFLDELAKRRTENAKLQATVETTAKKLNEVSKWLQQQ